MKYISDIQSEYQREVELVFPVGQLNRIVNLDEPGLSLDDNH